MIPKIIWQTHNYLYEDLPDHILRSAKTWQNLNPGWKYNYVNHIDREKFVKEEIPDLYKYYMMFGSEEHFMHQADLWRYAVIYKYGGVYSDMDSVCRKPLDYMLDQYSGEDIVFTKPQANGTVNNANFAAVPKSKTIGKIIQDIRDNEQTIENITVWTIFSNTAMSKKANFYFDADSHSKDLKKYFTMHDIDYYGEKMPYNDYLKNILKLDEQEFLASKA